MPFYTSKRLPTPSIVVSESAHRLALRIARSGKCVVYRCKNLMEIGDTREEVGAIVRNKFWFSHSVLGAWQTNGISITHRSGGEIIFMLYSNQFNMGRAVELEVHV